MVMNVNIDMDPASESNTNAQQDASEPMVDKLVVERAIVAPESATGTSSSTSKYVSA